MAVKRTVLEVNEVGLLMMVLRNGSRKNESLLSLHLIAYRLNLTTLFYQFFLIENPLISEHT